MDITPIPIADVIAAAGGASRLAKQLEINHSAVCRWKQVPPARAAAVERVTGISRHELRPDLWEPPAGHAA